MTILQIQNLSKSFETSQILRDINLQINKNEIFGIIGINGAGKTTLIKSIMNLATHPTGRILLSDVDTKFTVARQSIFYLPEKFLPPKNFTCIEFVQSYLKLYNITANSDNIYDWASRLDLNHKYLNLKISKLSKGTVQKIGLLTAFLSNRQLLILDEPMDGLDVKARVLLKNSIIDYKTSGKSVIFSSHILTDMEEICDRIGILDTGSFKFVGTINEFKNQFLQGDKISLEKAFLSLINPCDTHFS